MPHGRCAPRCAAVQALNDAAAHAAVSAERAFARRLGGSCQSPIAAFAELEAGGRLTLRGLVAEPDGSTGHQGLHRRQCRGCRGRWVIGWPSGCWRRAPASCSNGWRAPEPKARGTPVLPLDGIGVLITRPVASGGSALPAVRGRGRRRQPLSRHRHSGRSPTSRAAGPRRIGALGGVRSHHLRERQRGAVRRRVARRAARPAARRHRPGDGARLESGGLPRVGSARSRASTRKACCATPALASVAGQRVLLIKGQGGRRIFGAGACAARRGADPGRGVSARVPGARGGRSARPSSRASSGARSR